MKNAVSLNRKRRFSCSRRARATSEARLSRGGEGGESGLEQRALWPANHRHEAPGFAGGQTPVPRQPIVASTAYSAATTASPIAEQLTFSVPAS